LSFPFAFFQYRLLDIEAWIIASIHAVVATRHSCRVMLNLSFANITPFDAHIHVEEVEKTLRTPA